MKKIIITLILSPSLSLAQIPVTDAATNGQLVLLNKNIMALQGQISSLNGNMATLIKLMQKNVTATTNSSQSISQEIAAKRTAASFVLAAPEMAQLIHLKEKILEAYHGAKKNLDDYSFLDEKERKEAENYLGEMIASLSTLLVHAKTMASTPDLVDPSARLSQIQTIVQKMEGVLNGVIELNKKLAQRNEHRKAIQTVITIN
ncbi:hypothetical protein [Maribacter arenosus]|uniref:Type IV pili methyl-accepting chemotaxis transducer N-term n=1 Tax=Maribacter arenosus TaxID=1854708 RepID=A0ABR7VEZ3_9FLAO|nr:hypothetical protein [Maribacter arenosus]MBD0851943.1 hypothetical protein [Maribacter arenosus]